MKLVAIITLRLQIRKLRLKVKQLVVLELSLSYIPYHYTSDSQREVPRLAASTSPENLLVMQIIGSHPRPTDSKTLGVGA